MVTDACEGEATREVTEGAAENGAGSATEGAVDARPELGTAAASSISTSPSASVLSSASSARAMTSGGVRNRCGDLGFGNTCLFGGGVLVGDRVRERERLGGEGERFSVGAGLRLRGGGAGEYDLRRGERRSRSRSRARYCVAPARPAGLYRRFLSGVGLRRLATHLRSFSAGDRPRRARDTECEPSLISPGEGSRMGRERSGLYGDAEPLAATGVWEGRRRLGEDGVRALLAGDRELRSPSLVGAVEVSYKMCMRTETRTNALGRRF